MIQGQIVWFEIPVKNLDKAIVFYSEVLEIKIEKKKFLNQEHGVFNHNQNTIKGTLVVKEKHLPGTGVILFFYVIDLSDCLRRVEKNGGEIITEKTLLKQQTVEGHLTIKSNMIDGNVGYYADLLDCEGNRICLYSNS